MPSSSLGPLATPFGLDLNTVEWTRKRRPAWDPELDIDWNAPSTLPRDRVEVAAEFAGQEIYAEQTGQLVASRLLNAIPDYFLRVGFGAAVADEARHSETFARYAVSHGGVPPPDEQSGELHDTLAGIEHPLGLLVAHTVLEGWAHDAFRLFERAFTGDVISNIYHLVRLDEARHVRIGVEIIRRLRQDGCLRLTASEVHAYTELASAAAGVGRAMWEKFAWLSRRPLPIVEREFVHAHQRRCEAMCGERR